MICTVIDIRGDYAIVRYADTGVVSEVAIALLPFGVDVGDKLRLWLSALISKPQNIVIERQQESSGQKWHRGTVCG